MAPDDEIIEVNDGEEEQNIIDLNNYGMKPYSYRAAGGGNGSETDWLRCRKG